MSDEFPSLRDVRMDPVPHGVVDAMLAQRLFGCQPELQQEVDGSPLFYACGCDLKEHNIRPSVNRIRKFSHSPGPSQAVIQQLHMHGLAVTVYHNQPTQIGVRLQERVYGEYIWDTDDWIVQESAASATRAVAVAALVWLEEHAEQKESSKQ